MVLFLISFVAGILTVLAPCILPVLPIIVGGSVSEGKKLGRALTVICSLAVSVLVFTFLIKASTLLIDIPPQFWTWFSGGIIILFGLISLFPTLWEKIPLLSTLNRRSNTVLSLGYRRHNFWGDVVIGAALGPVFSTCSPTYFLILAVVLPESFSLGLVYLLAYVCGLALALLCIAYVSQTILSHVGAISDPRGIFKKILGVLFLIVGVAILSGLDKDLQTKLLDAGLFDVTRIEQTILDKVQVGQ